MVEAISPKQIGVAKAKLFPDAVFEAFNELIAENYTNGRAVVNQDAVVARIKQKLSDSVVAFKHDYLNVEEVYREKGWKVSYDKPAYNENYDATFTFKG